MNADRVEVSWDTARKKWLIRIEVGEEVIRRHCDASQQAGDGELRAAAVRTATDEGYTVAPDHVAIVR